MYKALFLFTLIVCSRTTNTTETDTVAAFYIAGLVKGWTDEHINRCVDVLGCSNVTCCLTALSEKQAEFPIRLYAIEVEWRIREELGITNWTFPSCSPINCEPGEDLLICAGAIYSYAAAGMMHENKVAF
jgi:hypothetical protein